MRVKDTCWCCPPSFLFLFLDPPSLSRRSFLRRRTPLHAPPFFRKRRSISLDDRHLHMSDSIDLSGGQRAAAVAALNAAKAQEKVEAEFTPSSQLSARQQAMKNLNRKGIVSACEASTAGAESQHGHALASLGIKDEPKVTPSWKQTGAQRNAAAARAEIRGSSNASEARSKFGGGAGARVGAIPPMSFVPVQKTPGGSSKYGSGTRGPAAPSPRGAPPPPALGAPPPPPAAASSATCAAAGSVTSEAAEGVEKDIALLQAGIKRLGREVEGGGLGVTFGEVFKDEELEQQVH